MKPTLKRHGLFGPRRRSSLGHAESHQKRRWLSENRAALDSSNTYVEQHGLPLARYGRVEVHR